MTDPLTAEVERRMTEAGIRGWAYPRAVAVAVEMVRKWGHVAGCICCDGNSDSCNPPGYKTPHTHQRDPRCAPAPKEERWRLTRPTW
jgi:hypothetical protein